MFLEKNNKQKGKYDLGAESLVYTLARPLLPLSGHSYMETT